MFLYNISCTAVYCCHFVLFKENSSTNSKTQTGWFVGDLKCMFKTPIPDVSSGLSPSMDFPPGGTAMFFLLDLTTCFQKCCRNPISLRASALFLNTSGTGRWVAQTEIHMAGDEIRFFSLKASQKPIPLRCTVTAYIVPSGPITTTFGDGRLNLGVLLFLF